MIVFLPKWWFYHASCIGPIIIIRERDYSTQLLNHEYIHYCQQKELLFIFAYPLYMLEFIIKLIWYRSLVKAYLAISFEREAHGFQNIIGYASRRNPYSWRHLIFVRKKKEFKGVFTKVRKEDDNTINND